MSNYFEFTYIWDEYIQLHNSEDIQYISYSSDEVRADTSSRIVDLVKNNKVVPFQVIYDYDKDSLYIEPFKEEYDLTSQTLSFLEKLNKFEIVILDITAMNIRVMGALLNGIKQLKFEKVLCVYTEPNRYVKSQSDDNDSGYNDVFELYKKFRGITPIPGFMRDNINGLSEKWIVFLGFEGKRILQIRENYEFNDIVTIVTLPSFKPGWQNYAIYSNIDIIKCVESKPDYIAANSYLDVYNYLEDVCNTYPNNYIRITPLGTKVNALGALLFALNHNENVEILYDNPKDEIYSDNKKGKTYVYDISELIHFEEAISGEW